MVATTTGIATMYSDESREMQRGRERGPKLINMGFENRNMHRRGMEGGRKKQMI